MVLMQFETLGIQGMLGIHETNEDWLTYTASSDTNFAQILADFNATIKQFGTDLGTPSHVTMTEMEYSLANSYIKVV